MSQADALIGRLDGVQGKGPKWRAICPGHASKHKTRSLAIAETDDGRVLLRCFAGCDVESILRAVGMQLADLFPPRDLGDHVPRVRKPWSPRDVARALEHELTVAWVVLRDMANGRAISATDRKRAALAADRCEAMLQELCA